jgi:hypothetical protein
MRVLELNVGYGALLGLGIETGDEIEDSLKRGVNDTGGLYIPDVRIDPEGRSETHKHPDTALSERMSV